MPEDYEELTDEELSRLLDEARKSWAWDRWAALSAILSGRRMGLGGGEW